MTLYLGSKQVPPMRYGNKPSEAQILRTWASGDWVAQEKKDGSFYQLEVTDEGEVYLFGRTVSKKTGEYTEKIANVPHIESWAKTLPKGTILIGEIYVKGGKSNNVTSIMGCTAANAYKRQFETDAYGGPVHYYVFDIIRYDGQDLCEKGFLDRYKNYLILNLSLFFKHEPYVDIAPVCYTNFEEFLQEIFSNGGEGAVFKNKNCPYRPGKRTTTSQMYKYKEHLDSIDLICMSLEEPAMKYTGKELETWPYWRKHYQTKNGSWFWVCEEGCLYKEYKNNPDLYIPVTKPDYYGWKNAMRLGAYKDGKLIEVCRVASGLTDADREDMGYNPDNWIGKVIEIECMSVDSKAGSVRHPVFRRIRDDKSSEDCLYDEIFGE